MIDFIWHQCQNKNGFKRYTYQKLKDELSEFATTFPFMSTQEVVDWARECHPNVSIHAYDSTYKKFMKHITSTPRHDISHVFFIKENHCYPITDERLKILATYHGFTCRSMDTAQAIWTSGLASGKKISIDSYRNSFTDQELFLVIERQTERIFSDSTSINRFVVSQAILLCLNLIYDNWTDESQLYSINTDGVFMTKPKHQYPNKNDIKFSTDQIGKVFTTNRPCHGFRRHLDE